MRRSLQIRIDHHNILEGDLDLPADPRGVVLFADAGGRESPTSHAVAAAMHRMGLATLVMDLLTESEEAADRRDGRLRFDILLLASRIAAATDWLAALPSLAGLPIGYFGTETGAAAASVAAAARADIAAFVVCGGRPDLAGPVLARVAAPTLLVVGDDPALRELNLRAMRGLRCPREFAVVTGHPYAEAEPLEQTIGLTSAWFVRYMLTPRPAAASA